MDGKNWKLETDKFSSQKTLFFYFLQPKSNYAYHTEAMDRAMEGGIDDVGIGVLFGLNTYRYDFLKNVDDLVWGNMGYRQGFISGK